MDLKPIKNAVFDKLFYLTDDIDIQILNQFRMHYLNLHRLLLLLVTCPPK